MAGALHASTLLMVIDRDDKFAMMGLSTEHSVYLSRADLNAFLSSASFESQSVEAKLQATARFLNDGGEQVIITTLRRLPATLAGKAGLHIGAAQPALARFG
jgi:carbamate kinase